MTADQVIRSYYNHYNAGEFQKAIEYFAEDVVYHDMIYDKPFRGKATMEEYLTHVRGEIPGLKFCIDDTTSHDKYKVGAVWHVELNGKEFPFSRGSSFYKVNDEGKIIYGRDIAEPSTKTGASVFPFLKFIASIMIKFNITPKPTQLKIAPIIWWLVYAAYMYHILFDPDAPGKNVTDMGWSDFKPTVDLSLNIYHIPQFLSNFGLTAYEIVKHNPVQEALFNGALLYAQILLPFMLADQKSKGMNRFLYWLGGWFLTNIFFFPFFAVRSARESELFDFQLAERSKKLPRWSPIFGGVTLALFLYFVGYGLLAGDQTLQQRGQVYAESFWNDRIFYAFNWDLPLFYIWQLILVEAPFFYKVVPFFGPVAYTFFGEK